MKGAVITSLRARGQPQLPPIGGGNLLILPCVSRGQPDRQNNRDLRQVAGIPIVFLRVGKSQSGMSTLVLSGRYSGIIRISRWHLITNLYKSCHSEWISFNVFSWLILLFLSWISLFFVFLIWVYPKVCHRNDTKRRSKPQSASCWLGPWLAYFFFVFTLFALM